MRESNLPIYSEELSQFLTAQAALMDAQPVNAMAVGMSPGDSRPSIKPMPPEYQLIHPRRVRWSGWFEQADGQMAHFIGYERLTPADEASYRLSDPENGLHPDDLQAFRVLMRGPVKRGPVAQVVARLKFWSSEVPRFLRKQAD